MVEVSHLSAQALAGRGQRTKGSADALENAVRSPGKPRRCRSSLGLCRERKPFRERMVSLRHAQ